MHLVMEQPEVEAEKPAPIMGANETGRASGATGYLLTEEMVGFVMASESREMEAPTKEGGALTQTAKELIALLVVMVVLVVAGLAYAANTNPAHYSASKGGPPG